MKTNLKRIQTLTCAALLALLAGCESSTTSVAKVEAKSDSKTEGKESKPDAAKPAQSPKEPNTPQQNEAAAAAAGERPVTSWHGSAAVETNHFYSGGADWNIKYATRSDSTNTDQSTPFQIYVMRADSGRMLALAVNTRGNTEGSTSVRTAPGMYYLKVAASTPWTVEVTDLR